MKIGKILDEALVCICIPVILLSEQHTDEDKVWAITTVFKILVFISVIMWAVLLMAVICRTF